VPAELVAEQARLCTQAEQAWPDFRARRDFAGFAPLLQKIFALKRRLAAAIDPHGHPFEVLAREYEPGLQVETLQALFGQLRERLVPLARRVHAAPPPRTDFLHAAVDPAVQRRLIEPLLTAIGYDFQRGRLDTSAHPFEISITRDDVRITTRFKPDYLPGALFSSLHEAGHAMYEQGVDAELVGTPLTLDFRGLYAMAGASYGTHESQSRLWENRIGRSLPFWQRHYAALQAALPAVFGAVSLTQFHRAINHSRPSLIRVEADELTYDLHIMLRVDAEMALLDGRLTVDRLPAFWNERMAADLGVVPGHDGEGVLQDVHWSAGLIGSFPSYTIGNVMAAQWMAAATQGPQADPAVAPALADANYAPLRAWLAEHVHRHGRTFTPDELLRRATGRGLDAGPYLDALEAKYAALDHGANE
jgi:carboxypeptidase Taq